MSIFMSFSRKSKVKVGTLDLTSPDRDPILCVPACDMKFSGVSTSRPRHCPPSQVELLRHVAGLSQTNFIGSQEEERCRWWSLRNDACQLLYDWRGLKIFHANMIPGPKPKTCSLSLFRKCKCKEGVKSVDPNSPFHVDFKVEIKDALGIIVLSLLCKRFWMSFGRYSISEVDEMEVFLGEYKLPIGKLVKLAALPGTRRFSGRGKEYYAVYDEKGALVYYVYLSGYSIEHSSHVYTFSIRGYEKRNDVGMIKCYRRNWARWLPKWFFGYGPAMIRFRDEKVEFPISHKCLLIGALFFILERTSLKPELPKNVT